MIDPIVTSAAVNAVIALLADIGKGVTSEVGKDTWKRVKTLFGWSAEPQIRDVPSLVAKALDVDPSLALQLRDLIEASDSEQARALVGTIVAEKVIVAGHIEKVQM